METIKRIYTTLLFSAVVGLAVGYYYESTQNARYESGEVINVQAAQQATYQQDWLEAVQVAGE